MSSYMVEQLIAVNPYNPNVLPDLENFVNEQVSSQTYLPANLCLPRMYQFEPDLMSNQIVARILVKDEAAVEVNPMSGCCWRMGLEVTGIVAGISVLFDFECSFSCHFLVIRLGLQMQSLFLPERHQSNVSTKCRLSFPLLQ